MDKQEKLIHARIARKYEMYATEVLPKLPSLNPTISIPRIVGEYSQTETRGKYGIRKRWIARRDSIQIGDLTETPTGIARAYVQANQIKPSRYVGAFKYNKAFDVLKRRAFMPGYARGGTRFDDGFYVDVRAAYFSILSLIGWNVTYNPGKYIALGRSVSDFPFPQNHIARDSLVSLARPRTLRVVEPPGGSEHIVSKQGYNELENLQLCILVSDIMHSLAALAIDAGACYVATDGYIAPNENVARDIQQTICDFGLTSRVKMRGAGFINSAGSYSIGDHQTKNLDRRAGDRTMSNVCQFSRTHVRWIQKNLEYAASKI